MQITRNQNGGRREGFQGAVEKVCHVFSVDGFFPEQKNVFKAFISREDILLILPTGFGKSMVLQMAP